VPGGGGALLYAATALDRINAQTDSRKVGVEIVRRATQIPVRQIAENAGFDGSIVVGQLLDRGDPNVGYDAQTGEYKDMMKSGISIRLRSCAPRSSMPPQSPGCSSPPRRWSPRSRRRKMALPHRHRCRPAWISEKPRPKLGRSVSRLPAWPRSRWRAVPGNGRGAARWRWADARPCHRRSWWRHSARRR